MTTFNSPTPMSVRIDTAFLLRQVPKLAQVRRKRRTWDEFGGKVFADFQKTPARRGADWERAKELVHAVVTGCQAEHDAIRKRLGNLQEPSTPVLMTTLTLWLAGALGVPVSMTIPALAAMFCGVAEAGGDWEVLRKTT